MQKTWYTALAPCAASVRRLLLFALLFTGLFAGVAQAGESPAQSFKAFMRAVMDSDKPEAERRAVIERYFDFDSLIAEREAAEGIRYDAERRAALKAEWMALFLSGEFQQGREVEILHEPEPQNDRAELIVGLQEPGTRRRVAFLVQMTRADGHWCWYSIRPTRDEPRLPATPDERLAAVLAELAELNAAQDRIAARIDELNEQRRRLEAELAEREADIAPYSTPLTTARNLGRALQAEDLDALLRAHLPARRNVDREDLTQRLRREAERVALWEPVDSVLRGEDEAVVRVKLQLWTDTGVKSRTLTLSLRRQDGEWLVDREP